MSVIRHAVYRDELLPLFPDDAGEVLLKFLLEVRLDQTLPHGDSKDGLNVDLRECVCHFFTWDVYTTMSLENNQANLWADAISSRVL